MWVKNRVGNLVNLDRATDVLIDGNQVQAIFNWKDDDVTALAKCATKEECREIMDTIENGIINKLIVLDLRTP